MADADDWMARYQAQHAHRKRYSERLAEYLVPALRFLGVTSVTAEFDGSGDSGQIEQVKFAGVPEADVPEGMRDVVETACYYGLPGGWEINAGSTGCWVIDVEKGCARLDIDFRDEDEELEADEE